MTGVTKRVTFFLLVFLTLGCTFDHYNITLVRGPRGEPDPQTYTPSNVQQHFSKSQFSVYAQHLLTPLSCVDGRSLERIIGTPGGEFSEFVVGLTTYLQMTNQIATPDLVYKIMYQYIEQVSTKTRKFYYHTEKSYLESLFATFTPPPTMFPTRAPPNAEEWYKNFVNPEFQGCGHINNMLKRPQEYGFKDARLIELSLQTFLKIFWTCPLKMQETIDFEVLQGELSPKAIVSLINEGPLCSDYSSPVFPTVLASSVFVYHPQVVSDYRKRILTPFFKYYDQSLDSIQFESKGVELATMQLNATLSLLDPAYSLNEFVLKITTLGHPPNSADVSLIIYTVSYFVTFSLMLLILLASCIGCFYFGKYIQRIGSRHPFQEMKLKKHTIQPENLQGLLENDYNTLNVQE